MQLRKVMQRVKKGGERYPVINSGYELSASLYTTPKHTTYARQTFTTKQGEFIVQFNQDDIPALQRILDHLSDDLMNELREIAK